MPFTNSMVQLDNAAPNQRRAECSRGVSQMLRTLCFSRGVLAAHGLIPPGFKEVALDIHSIDTPERL